MARNQYEFDSRLFSLDFRAECWSHFKSSSVGAVVTMGNPLSRPDDLAYVVDYVRPTVLITTPEVAVGLEAHWASSPPTQKPRLLLAPGVGTMEDPEGRLEDERCLSTALDDAGVPLSDASGEVISKSQRKKLIKQMDKQAKLVGGGK